MHLSIQLKPQTVSNKQNLFWVEIEKQVGLLNVDGYYNSLLSFIDKAVDEGFIAPAARSIIVSAQTAQDLMCKLEVHSFPQTVKLYEPSIS